MIWIFFFETFFYNCVKPSVNLLYFGVCCCCFFARLIPWSGYRRSKDPEYQGTVVMLNIGFIRSLLKTTHSPDWEEQNLLCLVHKYRTKHFQCMVNVLYTYWDIYHFWQPLISNRFEMLKWLNLPVHTAKWQIKTKCKRIVIKNVSIGKKYNVGKISCSAGGFHFDGLLLGVKKTASYIG